MSTRLSCSSLVAFLATVPVFPCHAPVPDAACALPTVAQVPYPLYPETLGARPDLPSPFVTADGVELITGFFDDERTYALIPVTVENGASRNYREGHRGKGKQLDVDADDFPTLARSGLHAEAELDATRTITGRPVDDITADGRPGALSSAGFLATDEDLVSVLKGDNRLAVAMGLTHPELAKPLLNLWNILQLHDARMLELGRPLQAVNRFWYNDHEIELISAGYGHGWQTSIFDDGDLGMWQIEIRRPLSPTEETYLAERYAHLDEAQRTELARRLSYIHTGEMVPFYIMRYGFYEGHTSYRADPVTVAFVFGLRTLEELDATFSGALNEVLTTHFNAQTVVGAPTAPEQCSLGSLLSIPATGRR